MRKQELRFEDCYFTQDQYEVTLGNSRIERQWRCSKRGLTTVRLIDKLTRRNWAAQAINPESIITFQNRLIGLSGLPTVVTSAEIIENSLSAQSLRLRFTCACGQHTIDKCFEIFPGVAAIRTWLEITWAEDMSLLDYTQVDRFSLNLWEASATAVELHDLTDYTNHLATVREFDLAKTSKLVGNNIFIEKADGEGIFGYKESPVPNSQLYHLYYDFEADKQWLAGIGAGFHNLPAGQTRRTYAFTFGVYSGGRDAGILALKEYQAARYKTVPERDYIISANSWGDFSTDINEEKLIAEVEAAAALGIESVAVDAGWTPHVMGGDPDPVKFPNGFAPLCRRAKELGVKLELWMVPTRLDGAIDVLKEHPEWVARTNNMTPCDRQPSYGGVMLTGIELCNPECFASMKDYFLRFYDEGFERFKMDTFQCDGFDSLEGDLYDHYEALRRLMHELVVERPGLTFTQDSTRTNRPIYDYYMDYGIIFLENRYQRGPMDGNGRYLPWKTLRNLWQVAPYIPPQKLNMELSNDEEGYTPEYLFATVMFANPLFWESLARISDGPTPTPIGNPTPALPATERESTSCPPKSALSSLEPESCPLSVAGRAGVGSSDCSLSVAGRAGEGSSGGTRARLKRMISLYKEHRAAIYAGHIWPLGDMPDGTAWTGFQSHDPKTGSGYLIVYREDNPEESHVFHPKFLTAPTRFESLTDDSPTLLLTPSAPEEESPTLPLTPSPTPPSPQHQTPLRRSGAVPATPVAQPPDTQHPSLAVTLPTERSFRLYRYSPTG